MSADRIQAGLLTAILLLLAGFSGALNARPSESDAAPPEPKPDKALVHYIRTGRLNGAAGSIYLFADKIFLGTIPNGAYGYSYLEPGRRLFWTTWTKATREIDLVPGETYYLNVWREIVPVDAATGRALIEKVSDLVTPSEEDRQKATKYIAKKYEGALEKESERETANVPELAAPAVVPDSLEGMLKIPAYTKGVLEFMESVTSEFSPAGTEVLLRLTDDVVVDGQVVVHAGRMVNGIVRESSQAGGYGKAGVMEVSVPGLKAEDGTLVPLVAQLVAGGEDTENSAAAAGAAVGGALIGLTVRGREAYYLAGEQLKVWTRQDAWVRPSPAPPTAEPTPAPEALNIRARCRQPVRFAPNKGYRPDNITIILETEARPMEVIVTGVADLVLPTPLSSQGRVRRSDGWHCTFDGWGLTRYLRVGPARQHVTLSGRLEDGRAFLTTVDIEYLVER